MAQSKERACAWCGSPFFGDKRYKYCSEKCYEEAHREQARVRYRIRYATKHEQECARWRDYYRRNKQRLCDKSRAWRQEHPEIHRENQRNFYRMRKEATGNGQR